MIKSEDTFNKNRDLIHARIEAFTQCRISEIELVTIPPMPQNWHFYNAATVAAMLSEGEERYLLVAIRRSFLECMICSTEYAIIDAASFEVVRTFSANDEG